MFSMGLDPGEDRGWVENGALRSKHPAGAHSALRLAIMCQSPAAAERCVQRCAELVCPAVRSAARCASGAPLVCILLRAL